MAEDDDSDFPCDFVYSRIQAIRNIAADLEVLKHRDARSLMKRAGDLALKHLELQAAPTVELATFNGKPAKERPL